MLKRLFSQVKQRTMRVYTILLVIRFILLAMDARLYPTMNSSTALFQDLYFGFGGLVDLIYIVTNPLLIILNWLASVVLILAPILETSWFPAMPAGYFEHWLEASLNLSLGSPGRIDVFVGVFDWLVIPAIIGLYALSPAFDKGYEFSKNLIWHFIIENSFTQKKQALYQEALLKRSRDLMKLNVEYKNLSQEASILKDSVNTDGLTRVFNKRFFNERMTEVFKQAKEGKRKLGLLMLDIDHFKKLNDNYGHLVGDDVLRDVASVLKEESPPTSYVCRFGGEEFAIILPDLTISEMESIAEAIKGHLAKLQFEVDGNLEVSVSQGLVYLDFSTPFAKALEDMEDFIKFADDELYRAKLEGRARLCVNKLG